MSDKIEKTSINIDVFNSKYRLSYLNCVTCKKKFFPDYVKRNDEEFYKLVLGNQKLTDFELNNYKILKSSIKVEDNLSSNFQNKIYCSFHYGAFKVISCLLHERNIDFSIVVNSAIMKSKKESILAFHRDELTETGRNLDFEIICADTNSGIIKMIRTLKKGRSLFILIDGGSGVGGFARKDKKLAEVNFLNKKIYSRTGIAFLSHYLNIPISTIISSREKEGYINIKFYPEIIPTQSMERERYEKEATQKIWNLFSKVIIRDPSQWEGMLYAHQFVLNKINLPKTFSSKEFYRFNDEDYKFYIDGGVYYLYNIVYGTSIKITDKLFNFLYSLKKKHTQYNYQDFLSVMNEDVLFDLIKNYILI